MVGILLAALAAACWGVSTVFTRLGLQHMRSTTGTLLSLIVGLLVVALPVLLFYRDEVLGLSAAVLLWFLVVGILNFPLGRLLNFAAVQRTGVARSTPIIAIAPAFAIALSVLFAGEQVTPLLLVGGLTTVAGIVLIVSQR